MKVIYTDVLVIGGGLAGLRIAIGARRRGHDAIVLSLVPPKRSHSAAAPAGGHRNTVNMNFIGDVPEKNIPCDCLGPGLPGHVAARPRPPQFVLQRHPSPGAGEGV